MSNCNSMRKIICVRERQLPCTEVKLTVEPINDELLSAKTLGMLKKALRQAGYTQITQEGTLGELTITAMYKDKDVLVYNADTGNYVYAAAKGGV